MKGYQTKFWSVFSLCCIITFIPASYGGEMSIQEPTGLPQNQLAKEPLYICDTKNYNFIGQAVVLNTEKKENEQQLFLIQNISEQDILVNHAPTQASAGASAGWASQLLKDHWSALALNQKELSFQCARKSEKIGLKPMSCRFALRICRATSPSFAKGTVGSYWVIENQLTLKDLLDKVKERGINLAVQ